VEIIERARKEGRQSLSEHESKEVLRTFGIPVTRETEVSDLQALAAAVQSIGFPLVLKASGPAFTHKTEGGLVRLDIRNEEEARAAFEEIMGLSSSDAGAVLVQEMVKGERELVVGLTRDVQFGPCVMFGLGGIFTEILRDVSFRVAPLEKRDALEMMREIKGHKILDAVRGKPAADLDELANILIAVGKIGMEQESIQEIDINPVILAGGRPVAADALIILE
jgi:acetyl-CoA synthetase (ADP-forming)